MSLTNFIRNYSRCLNWQLISQLYQKLLPPTCVLCGRETLTSYNLCTACKKSLPILSHKCVRCAQFLPSFTADNAAYLCGHCLKNPPPYALTHALFPYQPPIVSLIIGLKFKRDLSFAQTLGDLMGEKIATEWYLGQPLPDLILPMPLHAKRLCERGFNQAVEIARPIAAQFALPLDLSGIKRIKDTSPQSGLSALKRKQNMANAFKATRDYANLSIAVIDDVITTSHTIRELCKALQNAAAKEIHIWCCARR